MICYDCMSHFAWLVEDKGTKICQRCYGKRYGKKRCSNESCKVPTINDLKKKWERKIRYRYGEFIKSIYRWY